MAVIEYHLGSIKRFHPDPFPPVVKSGPIIQDTGINHGIRRIRNSGWAGTPQDGEGILPISEGLYDKGARELQGIERKT